MLGWIRPLRFLARTLADECTPRRLAAGVALGVVLGLLPKGNLIAIVGTMLLFAVRVNLGAGLLTALLVSMAAPLCDPLLDALGAAVLEIAAVQRGLAALFEYPLMPWSGLNNTVVVGSLIAGTLLAVPVYRLSLPLFRRYTPHVEERIRRWKLVQLLLGAELASRV